jgi:hypothetical protein
MQAPKSQGTTEGQPFAYRGWLFLCSTEQMPGDTFRPVAVCVGGPSVEGKIELPNDTSEFAYATAAEALRHAEQQATRWVHDRTGTGKTQL